jgi:hypothetical protein
MNNKEKPQELLTSSEFSKSDDGIQYLNDGHMEVNTNIFYNPGNRNFDQSSKNTRNVDSQALSFNNSPSGAFSNEKTDILGKNKSKNFKMPMFKSSQPVHSTKGRNQQNMSAIELSSKKRGDFNISNIGIGLPQINKNSQSSV